MKINWTKKPLIVDIKKVDGEYVFQFSNKWLAKNKPTYQYIFRETNENGEDVYYTDYEIQDDGTVVIATNSGGGSGGATLYGPYEMTIKNSENEYFTVSAGGSQLISGNETIKTYDGQTNCEIPETAKPIIISSWGATSCACCAPHQAMIGGDSHISYLAYNPTNTSFSQVSGYVLFYTFEPLTEAIR